MRRAAWKGDLGVLFGVFSMQLMFSGQHCPPCIRFRCLAVKPSQRTLHAAVTPSSLTWFLRWPSFRELSTRAPSTTAPVLTLSDLAADLSRVTACSPCVFDSRGLLQTVVSQGRLCRHSNTDSPELMPQLLCVAAMVLGDRNGTQCGTAPACVQGGRWECLSRSLTSHSWPLQCSPFIPRETDWEVGGQAGSDLQL